MDLEQKIGFIVPEDYTSITYIEIKDLLKNFSTVPWNKGNGKSVLGFGDILLSVFIGGWLGAINGILCLFLASVIGISFFFYSIIINKRESILKIPFGACISIAFIIFLAKRRKNTLQTSFLCEN